MKREEQQPEVHACEKVANDPNNMYYDLLNKHRYLLLFDTIDNVSADVLVSKLRALDKLSHDPIYLEINSPGGSVPDGIAIINAMQSIKSPVITIINGLAGSMAALISIAGNKRWMYKLSYWMQHSTSDIVGDYVQHMKDRTNFLCEFEDKTEELMRKRTKLTKKDFKKIRNGEMWLSAKQAKQKGIVDKII